MKKNGFTLIEIIIAMAMGFIVMMTVAMLVQSGYQSWTLAYNTANTDSRLDSIRTITAFGSLGRISNKKDYYVYQVTGTTFTRKVPVASPEENLTGQAVEFRYWSTDLTDDMLTPTSSADRYALFYLDNGRLMLDKGTSVEGSPTGGAIDAAGHRATGAGVATTVLADNVASVEFTHTTINMTGDGNGCVRMKLVINGSTNNPARPTETKICTFLAATYIRNIWPQ
jgi:prepilin-type N-terminal cleavage/methylation domain-containing protein